MRSGYDDDVIWEGLRKALTPAEAVGNDEAKAERHQHARLGVLANRWGLEMFRSLPIEERERILDDFRAASALELPDMTFAEYMAFFHRHKAEK